MVALGFARSQETNFGGNLSWMTQRYRPTSEAEILEILAQHSSDTIRVLGSKHSWSDVAAGAAVSLDMSGFDDVEPLVREGQHFVRVGAGVTLQTLLDTLHAKTDRTLPTLGAIKRQTISGATSTGTHGSGRQSLSHFVSQARVAAYDRETHKPVIIDYDAGTELRAIRCGLGCLGVVISLELPTVPKYKVAETLRTHESVQTILATYARHPLTQFLWVPHSWQWIAFERAPVGQRQVSLFGFFKARLLRISNFAIQDVGFHLGLLLVRPLGGWAVKTYLRNATALIIKGVERVDDAEHILTLGHHYFQHEEMELFVAENQLVDAVDMLQCVLEVFGTKAVSNDTRARVEKLKLGDGLLTKSGRYVHHYPVIIRRVLPDETLISMAASTTNPIYSISLFTYTPPGKRQRFYELCDTLARTLRSRLDARLHWGKHFPLAFADIAPLYPEMETFRALCHRNDPQGVFRNDYTDRVLSLSPKT